MPSRLPPSLRRELDLLGTPSRSRRYPPHVRVSASVWTRAQRAAGATAEEVSAELGIPWQTLQRWMAEPRGASFKTVEVVTEQPAGLVVHGPCGLRIEVRDVATLAMLLRSLA